MTWLHAVIDVPRDQYSVAADFWSTTLGWPLGPPWDGHPELQSFEPQVGTPYLHLQVIEGPSRVHVDVASDDPDATVAEAVGLGADCVAERDRWRTLISPGGLPFCVVRSGRHETPQPVAWPGGQRSRMVQVCIDSPRTAHDREVQFWTDLLGGHFDLSPAREFAGKWHHDGSPLQLLFQRLDDEAGVVRAHLDHGTDDRAAEVRRLLALGAEDVGPGRGWHVLRDPTGSAFCVTDNSPEAVHHRDLG
ncbi:MAG TPA: VOC family protein [Nocardioidaceae bacterium]|nr:VOC family protein [Nocardioidaceae bacterium]